MRGAARADATRLHPLRDHVAHVPAGEVEHVDAPALEPGDEPVSHSQRDLALREFHGHVRRQPEPAEQPRVDPVVHRLEPGLANELVDDVGLGAVVVGGPQPVRAGDPQPAERRRGGEALVECDHALGLGAGAEDRVEDVLVEVEERVAGLVRAEVGALVVHPVLAIVPEAKGLAPRSPPSRTSPEET